MAKLFEVLAAEKTVREAFKTLMAETLAKLQKAETYFLGSVKTLKLVRDSAGDPAAEAEEKQGSSKKEVTTSVPATLEYLLIHWVKAENLQYQKNLTNQRAVANVELRGETLLRGVPIDELMGLEARVTQLRDLFKNVPTLDMSKDWEKDVQKGEGFWRTKADDVATKTAKVPEFITTAQATDKHPAQVVEKSKEIVTGAYSTRYFSGAVTAQQKADLIGLADDLIVEIKKARQRANAVDVTGGAFAEAIVAKLMGALK